MIEPGTYRHCKGNLYRVIGVGKHTETSEDVVVYEALYANEVSQLWVRPLTMFTDSVEIAGVMVPRFERIGTLPVS